jgi:hypothetical protein
VEFWWQFFRKRPRLVGVAGGWRFFDARKFEGEGKFVDGRLVVLPPINPFIGANPLGGKKGIVERDDG